MIDGRVQGSKSFDCKIPICFLIASITTEHAGTEGHLIRLIRALDRRRYEPMLVVLQRSPWTDEFSDPLVPLEVLGFRSFLRPLDWQCIWRLAKLLKQHRIQILESHYPDAHLVGALAARYSGVPVIVSCRRDLVDQYGWRMKTLCKLGNYFATHHLVNSEAVAAVASRVEGVRRSRIEMIHNGVDLDAFEQSANASTMPEFTAAAARNRIVVLAANLLPIKNISMFIEVASIVAKRFGDTCFAVVGSGPEKERLKRLAAEHGVDGRMIWTGTVPDTRPYLKRSTIACLTSDSEGLSNSILEYMAAGLPVVATQVGGAAEAIVDGITGYLIPRGNVQEMAGRLIDLLANSSKGRTMGLAGRQRVADYFSLQAHVAAHQRLYDRLVLSAKGLRTATT
jgi:glycosyltransferase involved in cell wall biosynthesis